MAPTDEFPTELDEALILDPAFDVSDLTADDGDGDDLPEHGGE